MGKRVGVGGNHADTSQIMAYFRGMMGEVWTHLTLTVGPVKGFSAELSSELNPCC